MPSYSKDLKEIITRHTRAYLENELGLAIDEVIDLSGAGDNTLQLRDYSVVIGMGGSVNILAAFSFDRSLAIGLLDVLSEGFEIAEEEHEEYLRANLAEIVNMILGFSTSDLASEDQAVTLTPPPRVRQPCTIVRTHENVRSAQAGVQNAPGINGYRPDHPIQQRIFYFGKGIK